MIASENLFRILEAIPDHVKVIAVSKTQSADTIREVYEAGYRIFGENKAQELTAKQPALPEDVEWHFIGHLQTNKVKFIVPFVHMIQSIDRLKVLAEVNKQAEKVNRVIDCLLQFHIAEEETKFGLDLNEAMHILHSDEYKEFENVRICGVMGMSTFTEDESVVRNEFRYLRQIFDKLKKNVFIEDEFFKEISMGMSGDYAVAIEEGSTMIRIGSAIFGERIYK
jgi:pyridoxal phosphate enzyme (YggS family)